MGCTFPSCTLGSAAWTVVSELGSGTFGTVWCVEHVASKAHVAMKEVGVAKFSAWKQRTGSSLQYDSESCLLQNLAHPHIVHMHWIETNPLSSIFNHGSDSWSITV